MAKAKIRKNDEVIILTGKDKGRQGKVLSMRKDNRVLVEGINMCKKHTRPNPQKNVQGGIIDKEQPIHISNLAIYNPTTKKADKVGFKFLEDGRKVRYFKSNNEMVDV